MALKKGQMPESFRNGALQRKDLRSRTPEERKRISQMGNEARRKKKAERMALNKCMQALLNTEVTKKEYKELLRGMGVKDDEMTNSMLLMARLFRSGLSGDTQATKEIVSMMEKLDMFNEGIQQQAMNININLVPVGNNYEMTKEDEEELEKVEGDEDIDDDEWE